MPGWSWGSGIGAVISGLAGSLTAKTFLVGVVERGLEVGIASLVGSSATGKPGFTRVWKDAT